MTLDMNPPTEVRLRLAKDALDAAKTDWYRIKLNQPDDDIGQKEALLKAQEERAAFIENEIKALEAELKKTA